MNLVTEDQLIALLRQQGKSTFASIVSRTVPAMRKTDNPYFGRVVKVRRFLATLTFRYERAVNRQRARERGGTGTARRDRIADALELQRFIAGPRAWGRRIEKSPLVEHKGRFYLHVKIERILQEEFQDAATFHVIPADDLAPWIPRRTEGKRQGLRKPVVIRDYKIASIYQLRMKGVEYVVRERVHELRKRARSVEQGARSRKKRVAA